MASQREDLQGGPKSSHYQMKKIVLNRIKACQ